MTKKSISDIKHLSNMFSTESVRMRNRVKNSYQHFVDLANQHDVVPVELVSKISGSKSLFIFVKDMSVEQCIGITFDENGKVGMVMLTDRFPQCVRIIRHYMITGMPSDNDKNIHYKGDGTIYIDDGSYKAKVRLVYDESLN